MKCLVLKRRESNFENGFTEAVAAGVEEATSELPFEVSSHNLEAGEADDLRADPSIEDVVPAIPFTLITPFDEPSAGSSGPVAWGIEAVKANTSPQTGEGVTVAVLDTGIDTSHVAFSGLTFDSTNLMDFTQGDVPVAGSATDNHGHGTHVAGTIFGREVSGTRVGVAPGIKRILIGKVLGPNGGSTEAIVGGIEWAISQRADVISMSLGMDFPGVVTKMVAAGFPPDIAASRALEAYRSNVRLFDRLASFVDARAPFGRGALLVAASGNESKRNLNPKFTVTVAPPAAADGFIPIGAVGQTTETPPSFSVASFSNTGCQFAAPGVGIVSAQSGGGLSTKSGTSMATPHCAGVLALWIQKLFPSGDRPPGWIGDVRRAMENNVRSIPGLARADIGLGIIQAPQ